MDSNNLGQPVGAPVPAWQPPPRLGPITLQGQYCRLEPLSAEHHAADLHRANSAAADAANWTYMAYGPFATEADYRSWLAQVTGSNDPLFLAIIDLRDGAAVGVASWLRISPEAGSVEVGHISFSNRMQRTALATEAMYLMMRHAFELGYRRYEWKCNALNVASRAAAQRYGLSFEGVFRQAAVVKGRNRDTAWYAAIDSEWPRLSAAFTRWLAPANFAADGQQKLRLRDLTKDILVAEG